MNQLAPPAGYGHVTLLGAVEIEQLDLHRQPGREAERRHLTPDADIVGVPMAVTDVDRGPQVGGALRPVYGGVDLRRGGTGDPSSGHGDRGGGGQADEYCQGGDRAPHLRHDIDL